MLKRLQKNARYYKRGLRKLYFLRPNCFGIAMRLFLLLNTIFMAANLNSLTFEKLRQKLGVPALWSEGLDGFGVTIVVHDEFISKGARAEFSHGQVVESFIKSIALRVNIKKVSKDLQAADDITSNNPRIVNMSYVASTRSMMETPKKYAWNECRLLAKLVKKGVLVVLSAGNESTLNGTSIYSRIRSKCINLINNNKKYSGAVIMTGSGQLFGPGEEGYVLSGKNIAAKYSVLAGTSRDHYVLVPSSQVVALAKKGIHK
jgi:hypothetical protein